jgi:1-acyl-sn-glycerol-3-phosphate acyltransferase
MVLGSLGLAALTSAGASSAFVFGTLSALCAAACIVGYRRLPEFVIRLLVSVLSRVFYRLEVHGKENVPSEGPAIIVLNHVSFNDWMVVAASVRRPVRFVMDHRINALPVVRTFFRHGKTIPIAPAHEDAALMEDAFAKIRAELADGQLVCIYPEGKITKTGLLNPFKAGVERILAETQVPVVPMAVHGLWGSIFSRKDGPALRKWPRRFRARLVLEIGAPVAPDVASARGLEQRVAGLLARAAKG